MSSRREKGINGRFYSNGLELKHQLQKKKISDQGITTEILAVTDTLQRWVKEKFLDEIVRSLYG